MILSYSNPCKPLFLAAYSKEKRHFSLVVSNNEDLKMSTISSATPAQPFKQNNTGLTFALLLGLGAFLFYAVQSHLVTDCFVYLMSMLFDNFSVKSHSIIVDMALLAMFLLMMLGLFHLVKDFTVIFIAVIILSILVAAFTLEEDTSPKPLHSNNSFVYGG